MAAQKSEMIIRELLELANVEVNGKNPWDIQVHNPDFYSRVLQEAFPRAGRILHGRLVGLRGHR